MKPGGSMPHSQGLSDNFFGYRANNNNNNNNNNNKIVFSYQPSVGHK